MLCPDEFERDKMPVDVVLIGYGWGLARSAESRFVGDEGMNPEDVGEVEGV